VFRKTTVAQMQMCGAAQTEFVICDYSIDTIGVKCNTEKAV
jgi:hypothetical protein